MERKKKPTEQTSSSSSTRTQPPEELFSPERERASIKELADEDEAGQKSEEEDEDKLPVFEDYHLKDLIDLN